MWGIGVDESDEIVPSTEEGGVQKGLATPETSVAFLWIWSDHVFCAGRAVCQTVAL